jgi:hypothetical protein
MRRLGATMHGMTPTARSSRILLLVDRRTPLHRSEAAIRRYRLVRARVDVPGTRLQIRE